MLRCMPFWNACNRQIDYIDRRHCNLTVVPEEVIRPIRTLEELRLDANMIRELPRGLYRLTMLRKLTLSDNDIGKISPDIGHLIHLQELDASRNDIEDIPDTIRLCKNLQIVDFSGNPLTKLPEGFPELRNLTQLVLNDVSLNKLPTDIGSLSNLEILELRENMIKFLPASFSMLSKLGVIDLGCNMLEELPPSIGQLSNVQVLLLDGNDIMEISKDLGNLQNLTDLDVSENKLEKLPDEIGNLTCLTDLLLSVNHLESLPPTIGNLTKLRILKADQNQLLSLPDSIGKCTQLEELILTENLISELPVSIGRLKLLSNFNVDRNRLEVLPSEIGTCTRLGVLSLRDNKLSSLPSECGNLKELHVLDVSGNRLHHLPLSLGTCNLKAIWLSDNQAQPLLKFQEDIDESSGEKVLTCFLLPQEAYQTESMENLLKGSVNTGDRDSWNDLPPRPSAVGFVGVEDSDSLENDEESHFVRQNTPHPKELRSRHGRLAKKDVDGPIIPHDPSVDKEKNDVSFVPSRDMDYCDSQNSSSNKIASGQPPKVKISPPASPHGDDSSLRMTTSGPAVNFRSASSDISNGVTTPALESDKAPSPEVAVNTTVRIGGEDNNAEENEMEDSDNEASGEVRHVGFLSEFDELPEKESRLRRRDTPHHLKNKRITGGVGRGSSVAVDPEEKLRQILAQVEGRRRSSEGSGGASVSSSPAVTPNDEQASDTVVKTARPRVLFSVSADDSECGDTEKELTVHIKREPGIGLGISIAGGRGSTPYKNDDKSIFVSRVAMDSLSYRAGLRVDDKLLSVNGKSMVNVDHHHAVTLLKEAKNEIILVVSRASKSSAGDKTFLNSAELSQVELEHGKTVVVSLKRDKFGLGFSIAGGKGSPPFKGNDESIFISKVTAGGAAHNNGNVLVGDKIISINGNDVTEARHDEAVKHLTSNSLVSMVLYRELPQSTAASPSVVSPSSSMKSETRQQSANVPYQSQPKQYSVSPTRTSNNEKANFGSSSSSCNSKSNDSSVTSNAKPVKHTVAFGTVQTIENNVRQDGVTVGCKNGCSPVVLSPTHSLSAALSPTHSSPDSPAYTSAHSSFTSSPPSSLPHPPPPFSDDTNRRTPTVMATPAKVSHPHSPPRPAKYSTELTTDCDQQSMPEGVSELFKALDQNARRKSSSAGEDTKHPYPVQTVVLYKLSGSLGLSIVGGRDHTSHPFGIDEPGIFISKIMPNGAASETTMRVGDRVLSVDGVDLRRATHREAVACLTTPAKKITLVVRRDPQPPHMQEIILDRLMSEKFGMSIRGGAKSRAGNPLDKTDEGIFVSKIMPDGAVARNGCFRIGQRILEVNGESVLGATHGEAVDMIRKACAKERITFLVCYGFDPSLISGTETTPSKGSSSVVPTGDTGSSIDCEESAELVSGSGSIAGSSSTAGKSSQAVSSSTAGKGSHVSSSTADKSSHVVGGSVADKSSNVVSGSVASKSSHVDSGSTPIGSHVVSSSTVDKSKCEEMMSNHVSVEKSGTGSVSVEKSGTGSVSHVKSGTGSVSHVKSGTGSVSHVESGTGSVSHLEASSYTSSVVPSQDSCSLDSRLTSSSVSDKQSVLSAVGGNRLVSAGVGHPSLKANVVEPVSSLTGSISASSRTKPKPPQRAGQHDAKQKFFEKELKDQHERHLPANISVSGNTVVGVHTESTSSEVVGAAANTDDQRLRALNEAATNLSPPYMERRPREKFLSTARLEFEKDPSPTPSSS